MKITRQELLDLYKGLQAVKALTGEKFPYVVTKNIKKLESEIKAIERKYQPTPAFETYEAERIKLCIDLAKKDKKGDPVTKMGDKGLEYDFEDRASFDDALKSLKEVHKDGIAERDAQEKEYNELLLSEMEVGIHKIDPEYLPKGISAAQTEAIWAILDHREEVKAPQSKEAGAGLEAVQG